MKDSDKRAKEVEISATQGAHSSPASGDETDYGLTRESLDKKLAEALEYRFTEVLDCVYALSNGEIRGIDDRGDYLDVVFRMPFFLPDPDYGYGALLATRSAQSKLRRGFITFLRKREVIKDLSDFLFTKLAQFLLEFNDIGRYSKGIQKHLRRIAQKRLAGRPHHSIGENLARRVKKEGVDIYRAIQRLQRTIERWKKADPKIEEQAIKRIIDRRYPTKNHPWMPFFTSVITKIPRKPYFGSEIDPLDVDENGKLLPARLSEPNRWSTIDIAVKILQKKLLDDTNLQFPLLDIKRLLVASLRPKRKLSSISISRHSRH